MEKKIVFLKKKRERRASEATSIPIRIGIDEHERIREIAEYSGKSLTAICNQLLQFALAHSHLSDNENM